MNKFQIVKCALMQITAIVYGVLFSGAATKFSKPLVEAGYIMPQAYYRAIFFRDHGAWLFFVVIIWTVIVAYLSAPISRLEVDEETLAMSGGALAILLAIIGTIIAIGGIVPPPLITRGATS